MPVTGVGGGPSRLFGPAALTTANATAFTAQQPTILRDAKVSNSTSASVAVTIAINGSVAANQIVPAASVGASSPATFALDTPLNVGDTVQALGGAAGLSLVLTGEVAGAGV